MTTGPDIRALDELIALGDDDALIEAIFSADDIEAGDVETSEYDGTPDEA